MHGREKEMDIIGKLFKKFEKKSENFTFDVDFLREYILISIKSDEKIIPIYKISEDNEILNFSESDMFDLTEDRSRLILSYEDIYNLDKHTLDILNLPEILNGVIYVDNSTYFLNLNGVRFNYKVTDGLNEYRIIYKNYICNKNNNKRFFIEKEQYELIKLIDAYNRDTEKNKLANEQYKILNGIKNTSHKANIILNDALRKEDDLVILDSVELDFLPVSNDFLEVVPYSSELNEEQNEKLRQVFKESEISKDFYILDFGRKKVKVVVSNELKNGLKVIKKNESKITVKDFITRKSEIFESESENIEFNYGPRCVGLGYLNYRPSPIQNDSEVDWFHKEFPEIMTDPIIRLKPEHLNYLKEKLEEGNDEVLIQFDTDEGIKKLFIPKEELVNEINKLNDSIKEIYEYNNVTMLNDLIELAKLNSEDDYFEYNGNYVRNPKNIKMMENIRDSIKEKGKEKIIKEKEEVLLLKDNISELEYTENAVKSLLETVEIPENLKSSIKLLEHQKIGLAKMQSLYKSSKVNGLLLCDDMGLGKTLQILSFLAWLKEKNEITPSLIIMPTSLISNWFNNSEDTNKQGEIQKFFKSNTFKVGILEGKKSSEEITKYNNFDIVLSSYESLRINHKETGKIKWKVVICDEAQKMKNPRTLLTTAIKTQNVQFKIACSATPIENSLIDLWCLADFVKPGLLKSQKQFEKEFVSQLKVKDMDDDRRKDINNKLKEIIENFYIRRTKDEELPKDFPKKIVIYDRISPSKVQVDRMNELYALRSNGGTPLAIIQGLIMVCSHPILIDKSEEENWSNKELVESAHKLGHVLTILADVKLKNEKVIIFTKYRRMQKILKQVIHNFFDIRVNIINGEDDTHSRRRLLDEYKKKEGFNVIILSPEAAGVGLNIVEANHVIHYTRHWNPAKEEQATDRAYRIGQEKDVYVYYPIISDINYNNKETSREIFRTVNEWIDKQVEEDVKNKSPEEKLNKIIIKKKKMLKDFFLASSSELDDDDLKGFNDEESDIENNLEKNIEIESIDSLDPSTFEKFAVVLLEKEIENSRGFVTPQSGDKGIDGLILSDRLNILIQCKHTKKLDNKAVKDLNFGEAVYSKELNLKFHKLVIFTSTNDVANNIIEHQKKYDERIQVYNRNKIAELLKKYPTKPCEIHYRDKRHSIEELKELIL